MNAKINLPHLDDDAVSATDAGRVSRFDVERLACGELHGPEKARVEAALAADPALKAFFDDVVASDRAFLITQPPAAFVARLPVPATQQQASWLKRLERFVMRWEAGVGVLAAATAIVIVINVGAPQIDGEGVDGTAGGNSADGVRSKGAGDGPSVGFFVQESPDGAAGARVGQPGEALRAGDRIQLAVKDVDKRAMVVVGVDSAGVVDVYAREQITSTNKGPSHKPRLLPASLVLDDAVGAERFFVVYGDDVEQLELAVTAAAQALGARVKGGANLADEDQLVIDSLRVEQASVHIQKVR